jgi:uncharacterized protein involved in exopolysaccharide biosynthesis
MASAHQPGQPLSDPHGPPIGGVDEVEINVVQYVVRIVAGYRVILGWTLAGCLLSIGVSMLLHKTYTAEAMFLPPISAESLQASSIFSRQNPSDMYLGMLSSRTVADDVIDRVHLKDLYHTPLYTIARSALARQAKFSVSKNNLISINVVTEDPKLSMEIANAYLEALYRLNGSMTASASAHRKEFFQTQLDAERNSLAQAEAEMQAVQERTGIILPEGEAAAGLTATARLEGALQDAQTRLSSLLLSETDQNPQVQDLRKQIATLEGQIAKQQVGPNAAPGSGLPSGARLPGLMADYLRKSRALKERDALYESLLQQYEKARLASDDPGPQLQVVDRAVLPERKSGPPRTLIVLAGTLLGGFLGLLWVLLAAPLRQLARRYAVVAAMARAR